ncbi:hypothetical protein GCM10022254_55510 [Actinomadura meridiana]|uniref:SnoaL-like domain-containing protein n=1 Tax=Actinomadura meridiana TaxID=559626 RepID=A0ABP8CFI2_9ACTN
MATDTPIRAALGVENLVLSYHYLNLRDPDGYASLLDELVVVNVPGQGLVQGRTPLLRHLTTFIDPRVHHHIDRILTDGGGAAAVIGRLTSGNGETGFVDIVELSDECLLTSLSRYVSAAPPTLN